MNYFFLNVPDYLKNFLLVTPAVADHDMFVRAIWTCNTIKKALIKRIPIQYIPHNHLRLKCSKGKHASPANRPVLKLEIEKQIDGQTVVGM